MPLTAFRLSFLTLAAFLTSAVSAPLYAQTQPVTLAWDANPESSVAGYVVYVGNASGSYAEQYDVGNQTSFVYSKVTAGRPYFFAVAAYTPGRDVSPPSEEIFFLTGPSTGSHVPMSARAAQMNDAIASSPASPDDGAMASSPASSVDGRARCTATDSGRCYSVDRLVNFPGDATALTPIGDGRMLFVANGKHVRVIASDTLMPDAALSADDSTQLAGLVLDPLFDQNRYVYVGEILTRADGRRELSLVRYREVASALAEGAAIVSGILLPASGDAPFTLDTARRLYVAVPAPADGSATGTPYAGMVLRFESDGSVARDSRGGSPVLAHGYAEPVSLAWTAQEGLWLAGTGANWNGEVARLAVGDESSAWPRVPRSVDLDSDTSIVSLSSVTRSTQASTAPGNVIGNVILVDDAGELLRIDGQRVLPAVSLSATDLGGDPVSAALDGADIYVVVGGSTNQGTASEIVRLRRMN